MAQSGVPEETKQLSLQIGNFSELYNYEKIRILGSGGFAKVYLVRRIKETTSRKGFYLPNRTYPVFSFTNSYLLENIRILHLDLV